MNNEVLWYYIEGDKQIGPVSENEIAGLIQAGHIKRDTYVWKEGMGDWAEAYMSDLAGYFTAEAPGWEQGGGNIFDNTASSVKDFVSSHGDLKKKLSWWFNAFWICEALSLFFTFSGLFAFLISGIGLVFSLLIIYHGWKLVVNRPYKLSPLAVTLLSLIPIFYLYWNFVCYYGLARELNREIENRGIAGNKVSEGLTLAYAIIVILMTIGLIGFMMYLPIGAVASSVVIFVIKLLMLRSFIEGMSRLL